MAHLEGLGGARVTYISIPLMLSGFVESALDDA